VAPDKFSTLFEVKAASPSITRVELLYENGAFEAIDDLEFDGEPPAPPPPTPPVVQITAPLNGADLDVNDIDIAGTVTGEGLLSPVFVHRRKTAALLHGAALPIGPCADRVGDDPAVLAPEFRPARVGAHQYHG
jgi:hypothetical protein